MGASRSAPERVCGAVYQPAGEKFPYVCDLPYGHLAMHHTEDGLPNLRLAFITATMDRTGCDRAEAEVIVDRVADKL